MAVCCNGAQPFFCLPGCTPDTLDTLKALAEQRKLWYCQRKSAAKLLNNIIARTGLKTGGRGTQ
jgi:hypothetical protein